MRHRIKSMMRQIKVQTTDLTEEQFIEFLEWLKNEIDEEIELLNWKNPEE